MGRISKLFATSDFVRLVSEFLRATTARRPDLWTPGRAPAPLPETAP